MKEKFINKFFYYTTRNYLVWLLSVLFIGIPFVIIDTILTSIWVGMKEGYFELKELFYEGKEILDLDLSKERYLKAKEEEDKINENISSQ